MPANLNSSFEIRNSKFISSLDKGHLVDFAERGAPFLHFLQRRLAQEGHSFLVRRLLDLRSRAAVENHAANAIGEVEKFGDRGAAMEAGAVALQTARPLLEDGVAVFGRIEAGLDEKGVV